MYHTLSRTCISFRSISVHPRFFCGVCIAQSLDFWIVFHRSLFVLLTFLFWPLYCLCFKFFLIIRSLQFHLQFWWGFEPLPSKYSSFSRYKSIETSRSDIIIISSYPMYPNSSLRDSIVIIYILLSLHVDIYFF